MHLAGEAPYKARTFLLKSLNLTFLGQQAESCRKKATQPCQHVWDFPFRLVDVCVADIEYLGFVLKTPQLNATKASAQNRNQSCFLLLLFHVVALSIASLSAACFCAPTLFAFWPCCLIFISDFVLFRSPCPYFSHFFVAPCLFPQHKLASARQQQLTYHCDGCVLKGMENKRRTECPSSISFAQTATGRDTLCKLQPTKQQS